jgi:hypothetical protein
MKKHLLFILFFVLCFVSTQACEFEFSTENKAKSCKSGDELVINVKLTLTHRRCSVAPSATKFKTVGMDVFGATAWKEASPGVWTRQVKVRVQGVAGKKVTLTATRTCDKDGGYGVFELVKV